MIRYAKTILQKQLQIYTTIKKQLVQSSKLRFHNSSNYQVLVSITPAEKNV